MSHPQSADERNAAYASAKSLGWPITRDDTDARDLTPEKTRALLNWVDCQRCSTFEDRDGNQFPLQAILDVWHATIGHESFDAWIEEDRSAARKAFIAVCRRHGIAHRA